MAALHQAACVIARSGALIGGLLILGAALVIAVDIILRSTLVWSIGGADELSGYALAIAAAWGLSYAALERSHIRIDSLYERLPPALRVTLDLASIVAFLFYIALTTWYAWGVFWQSWRLGARSISALAAPIALPQALWFAGLLFLVCVLMLLLVQGVAAVVRGDLVGASRLIGCRSVAEEVSARDERRQAQIHLGERETEKETP